jgi:thiol-disulfide isomerase/thioredoxin
MNSHFIVIVALACALCSPVRAAEPGSATPICALKSLGEESPINMGQFKGKVVYVDFWASWCAPCVRSFPFMNELDREFRDRGLQVLAINLDEKLEDAQKFLAKHPAGFILAADRSGQCPRDFGVRGMPSSYLVDRQGIIRHVHLGFRPGDARKLRALVEQLLAEGAGTVIPAGGSVG